MKRVLYDRVVPEALAGSYDALENESEKVIAAKLTKPGLSLSWRDVETNHKWYQNHGFEITHVDQTDNPDVVARLHRRIS